MPVRFGLVSRFGGNQADAFSKDQQAVRSVGTGHGHSATVRSVAPLQDVSVG